MDTVPSRSMLISFCSKGGSKTRAHRHFGPIMYGKSNVNRSGSDGLCFVSHCRRRSLCAVLFVLVLLKFRHLGRTITCVWPCAAACFHRSAGQSLRLLSSRSGVRASPDRILLAAFPDNILQHKPLCRQPETSDTMCGSGAGVCVMCSPRR